MAALLAPAGMLAAQDSGDEKLDLILAELQRLNASMEALQDRVETLEDQIVGAAAEAVVVAESAQAERPEPAGESLVDRVVDAIHTREESLYFPWMEEGLWLQLEEGMSQDGVIAILGEPTLTDPSLKRWVDTVFTYKGRRPSTGERVTAKVRFYKDKLVNFEAP